MSSACQTTSMLQFWNTKWESSWDVYFQLCIDSQSVHQKILRHSLEAHSALVDKWRYIFKEQITFLNQNNDFTHMGRVCYGVSYQSPALKRTQTVTMKNTFWEETRLFSSFLIVCPRTVQPPLLATHCHLQDSQQLAGNNLFPSHDWK